MRPEITQKLASLPMAPGVYLMKDKAGTVFYVGKAKSLRDRVRSYFSGSDARAFVALLDDLLADIDVVLTDSEKEALLLEDQLVKEYQPRFNVRLTDDKRFLSLRLDTRQRYPRLEIVRRVAKDGARYFGPYDSARAIRETLRIINRHFQLRVCSDPVMHNRTRPCILYQIKRCPAPCVHDLSDGTYAQNVANVVAFLEGRTPELVESLRARMRERASRLDFEAAAQLRDQIAAIERSLERQRMVTADFADRDVIGLYREGPAVEVHVMRAREGRLSDARRFSLAEVEIPASDVLEDFALRYYQSAAEIPDEILFPLEMQWAEPLASLLSERAGHAVQVLVPQRGDKRRLVLLAERNARQAFADKQRERGAAQTAIERLQRALHLRRLPVTLECFDISHLGGRQIVASAVRFEQGQPDKDRYRRYGVRSLENQDDFQSMYEIISRRARRGVEESDFPDLLVIDGGKGQLAAARAALDDHGIGDEVELVALAKSHVLDDAKRRPAASEEVSRSPERVFVLGQKNAVVLRQDSAELFVLTRARDEAHRFAVTYQRTLRRKAATLSVLDGVPGIGPRRRQALLRRFGSVSRLREASLDEIAKIVGARVAQRLAQALRH